MSKKMLTIIDRNKTLRAAWSAYLTANKLGNERLFIRGQEPTAKIYDLFFSQKPKVKIKFIEKEIEEAQKLYEDLTFAAVSAKLNAKQAHQAAIKNKGFAEIHAKAKKTVEKKIGAKLVEFMKSDAYDKYLESQIDGPMLSQEMGMNATCNRDLATAKFFMVKGKKNSAKSYIQNAIKAQAIYISKQKKVPPKYKPLTEAELMKKLDKFDVGVPQAV